MSNTVTNKGMPQNDYGDLNTKILCQAPSTASEYAARIEDMDVNTPSLINRDTEIKNLKKNLKVRGGFDGNMWQAPRAGRCADTGKVFVFDGDHSRHLFKAANPDAKTMPMQIIDVDTKSDIHRLFVQTNKTCKTSITAEQTFVHSVYAGVENVQKYAEILNNSGMYVYCSHEAGGSIGDEQGVPVKFSSLKSAVEVSDNEEIVREAKEVIMKCKHPRKEGKPISGEMLTSLCLLFSAYPALRPNNACGQEFAEFFVEAVGSKFPERFGKKIQEDCKSRFKANHRMTAGLVHEIMEHQIDHPKTFAEVSKGAYQRIQKGDLRRFLDNRSRRGKKTS